METLWSASGAALNRSSRMRMIARTALAPRVMASTTPISMRIDRGVSGRGTGVGCGAITARRLIARQGKRPSGGPTLRDVGNGYGDLVRERWAYLGPEGTFTEQAVHSLADRAATPVDAVPSVSVGA